MHLSLQATEIKNEIRINKDRNLNMDYNERIKNFILRELCADSGLDSLAEDEKLLEKGIIDSMGILNLLAFLEENFDILLSTEELDPRNFSTLKNIYDLVAKKLNKN